MGKSDLVKGFYKDGIYEISGKKLEKPNAGGAIAYIQPQIELKF